MFAREENEKHDSMLVDLREIPKSISKKSTRITPLA